MEVTEENMTITEMLEKIVQLDYSQNQMRGLNTEMRHWLEIADDDMAALRSENVALKQQVKALEKIASQEQQVEAEPSRFLLNDDLNVKRYGENKIQKLEEESNLTKEQNKTLNAELKNLQQEREQDKISLSKLKVAFQTLKFGMEEAQLGLLHRDEVIHQKTMMLKYSEETIEECSIIIKDLRLANQELRRQLDNKEEEAIFSALMDEGEGSLSPPLSFADEIKFLAVSNEVKSDTTDFEHQRHGETEAEDLLKPHSLTEDLERKRYAGTSETPVQKAGLFMMCIFAIFVFFIFVTSGSSLGGCDSYSIRNLWTSAHLMLQPYCRVEYGALPPI